MRNRLTALAALVALCGTLGAASPRSNDTYAVPTPRGSAPAALSAALQPTNCFYCMICQENTGHSTPGAQVDGVQYGHTCFAGYTTCGASDHPACSWSQGVAAPARVAEYMALASAAGRGSTAAIGSLLKDFPERASYNAGRQALQLAGCTPDSRVGNIPLSVRQVATLALTPDTKLAAR